MLTIAGVGYGEVELDGITYLRCIDGYPVVGEIDPWYDRFVDETTRSQLNSLFISLENIFTAASCGRMDRS
jgi:hypothetical protein